MRPALALIAAGALASCVQILGIDPGHRETAGAGGTSASASSTTNATTNAATTMVATGPGSTGAGGSGGMGGALNGCDDGVKDGSESDVDCGGMCPQCPVGKGCLASGDCVNGNCVNGSCCRMDAMCFECSCTVNAVAAGASTTCAIKADHNLSCWGDNSQGQIGDGFTNDENEPKLVSELVGMNVTSVAVGGQSGSEHACAVASAGMKVLCWGNNASGQLGNGTTTNSASPMQAMTAKNAVAVAVGGTHSCAIWDGGTVSCWGNNDLGQLGDGTTMGHPTPTPVKNITNAIAIALGHAHSCALLADHTVECWGDNSHGQIGFGSKNPPVMYLPVQVQVLDHVTAIAAGDYHTCAIANHIVYCWGANDKGQVGAANMGMDVVQPFTLALPLPGTPTAIAAGSAHSCAVAGGTVTCWGDNDFKQLGTSLPTHAVSLALGLHHSCASLTDGTMRCWGDESFGQLGNGTKAPTASISPVEPLAL